MDQQKNMERLVKENRALKDILQRIHNETVQSISKLYDEMRQADIKHELKFP